MKERRGGEKERKRERLSHRLEVESETDRQRDTKET